MMRFVVRALSPLAAPFIRVARSKMDARYVTRADHRRDIKDTLWEIQMLRREMVAMREEMDRLRKADRPSAAAGAQASGVKAAEARAAEAHRLATETAEALDKVLQNEVRIWQAIDELSARVPARG